MRQKSSEEQWIWLALFLGMVTTAIGLAVFAYLGTFSRYTSDDYCLSAFFLNDNLLDQMTRRYFVSSSRYTNILFIGFVDALLGWYNVAILPGLMLILFVLGLYLMLKEVERILNLRWNRWMISFLASSIVFFSVLQAPALYETLYWRAGMTSHFAPLVFLPCFGAFLLRQIRLSEERIPSLWAQLVCLIGPLIIGGFSEPPTALLITVLVLAIFATWIWGRGQFRKSTLILLLWSLAGALLALVVLALAPANSLRLGRPPPGFLELVMRIFLFPVEFILDTLQTRPTPTIVSFVMAAVLFYVYYSHSSRDISNVARNRLGILLIAILLLAYLLIAASFAPSAYGQSYPVGRARFAGRLIMTSALLAEGALLGILISKIRLNIFQSAYAQRVAILVLIVLMLYPLRTAWQLSMEIPAYQQRATAWDKRDAEIRALKAQGVGELVVPFLSDDPIQDLGDRREFRLNRCAAALYGVDSILAVPMREE
ncbi:MAG TPA: DUF6056 family protein [Anaerolineales bacterium]|nr:DUF6056 family protein [Anaerolineales bacterium]